MRDTPTHRRTNLAGLALGIGLGGLFDGIVFHQILQWHHLICTTDTCAPTSIADLQRQNFADGLFHAACWVITTAAAISLATAPARPRVIAGLAIAGWGLFNLVEGLIDHQLLGIHHVRPGDAQRLWDAAFLGWGAAFAALGFWLARRPRTFQTS